MPQGRVLALVCLSLVGCAGTSSQANKAPELPISRVVLYQNGVGYFERRGELAGDVLTLQVRPDQINDILKSLTVLDMHDGRAVSVSLPLEKRGADVLAELPEQVRSASGLLQVLAAFRGARVVVDGDAGKREGRVVGVEPTKTGDGASYRLTLKTDDGMLVIYPVDAIEEVTLGDRTLVVGLDRSLDVSLDEGDWKPVALSVRLAGASDHELMVSYIAEMPVWKPTYRIVLDGKGDALLQGWAVVDNVSGDDWRDARLSLVAGNPVSFRYDLHSPQFTQRVDLTPHHRSAALAPVIESAGMATSAPAAPSAAAAPSGAAMRAPAPKKAKASYVRADDGDLDEAPEPIANLAERMRAQAPPAARGASMGALFRYDLVDPVTVPDGSSSLVSIVSSTVRGAQVVLFRPEDGGDGYRAIKVTNATGSTLERGPVAIYDGSTFAGEAFVDRMAADTTSFLTYAQEGSVHLTRSDASSEEGARLLKIVAGMIETQAQAVRKVTLNVRNDAAESMTSYVKLAPLSGATLRNKPADTVETADAIFVPVTTPARTTGKMELEWVQPVVRRIGVDSDVSTSVLKLYLGSGKVPPELQAPLKEIVDVKEKLADNRNEAARLEKTKSQLESDESRLRANIDTLRRTSGNGELLASLSKKLSETDNQLGTISAKLVRLSEEAADLERRMNQLIKGITFDTQSS